MSRDHAPQAERDALARMFRTWPSPDAKHDGRDLVLEALDDPSVRKAVAQQLHAGVQVDHIDEAAIGKAVADRVIAYARSLPRFEDEVAQAEADLNDRSDEDEARDRELEEHS